MRHRLYYNILKSFQCFSESICNLLRQENNKIEKYPVFHLLFEIICNKLSLGLKNTIQLKRNELIGYVCNQYDLFHNKFLSPTFWANEP